MFLTIFKGGIKAVVFTDAFQVSIMVVAVLTIVILGMIYEKGPSAVFEKADRGGRLIMLKYKSQTIFDDFLYYLSVFFFSFNPSMYVRHTVWSVFIGGFSYWTSFNSCNQTMVQRYMTLPTLRQAKQLVQDFLLDYSPL